MQGVGRGGLAATAASRGRCLLGPGLSAGLAGTRPRGRKGAKAARLEQLIGRYRYDMALTTEESTL